MSMNSLIEVFRMGELPKKTRASVIIKLGDAINMQLGGNYTEPLVFELVKILDPDNAIINDEHFRSRAHV
ncbi:MAG: hypothetical protein WCD70_15050 [Alphaproteobacteria bacterium]